MSSVERRFSEFTLRPNVDREAYYCKSSFFRGPKPLHLRFYDAIGALIKTPGVQPDTSPDRSMREIVSVKFNRPTLVNNLRAQRIEAAKTILLQNCVVEEQVVAKENLMLINCRVGKIFCDGALYLHDTSITAGVEKFKGIHVSFPPSEKNSLLIAGLKLAHDLLTTFNGVTFYSGASLNGTVHFRDRSGKPFKSDGVQISNSASISDPERVADDIFRIKDTDVVEDKEKGKAFVREAHYPSCKQELISKKREELAKQKRCCIKITFGRACAFAAVVGAVAYAWFQRQLPQTQTGGLFSLFGK